MAAYQNKLKTVKYLIKKGAKINYIQKKSKDTALSSAISMAMCILPARSIKLLTTCCHKGLQWNWLVKPERKRWRHMRKKEKRKNYHLNR
jgi:hypothetical protein